MFWLIEVFVLPPRAGTIIDVRWIDTSRRYCVTARSEEEARRNLKAEYPEYAELPCRVTELAIVR
jgi:hypothetical protein